MTAPLMPEHREDLQKSGLSEATIIASHVHSVPPAELRACGMLSVVHALAFPYWRLDGTDSDGLRWKLFYDEARGDQPKYWQPKGSDPQPYFPPLVDWHDLASDPTHLLVITEGEKKALAACQAGLSCIGLAGVWNWRAKLDSGERLMLPGLDQIVWKSRSVELVPDSDVWRPEKKQALAGFYALGRALHARGAHVVFVKLPEGV